MVNPKKPGGGPDDGDLEGDAPTLPFVRRVEGVKQEDDDQIHARVIDGRAFRAALGMDLDAVPKAELPAVIGVSRPGLEALLTHNSLLELPPDILKGLLPGTTFDLVPFNEDGTRNSTKTVRHCEMMGRENPLASFLHPKARLLPQVGSSFGFAGLNGALDYISPVQRIHVLQGDIFLITKSAPNIKETIYKLIIKKSATPTSVSLSNNSPAPLLGAEHPTGFPDLRPLRAALECGEGVRRAFRPGTHVLLSKISHEGNSVETFQNKDDSGLIATFDQEQMETDPSLSALPIVGKKFFIFLANGKTIQTGTLKKVTQEEDGFVLITVNDSEYRLVPLT